MPDLAINLYPPRNLALHLIAIKTAAASEAQCRTCFIADKEEGKYLQKLCLLKNVEQGENAQSHG